MPRAGARAKSEDSDASPRADGPANDEAAPAINISAALREQLALITFVILFAGLVATDTYYAGFGLRFQLLDLSMPYLVYRGLTAALGSYALVLAYVLTIIWLSIGADWLGSSSRPFLRTCVQPLTYILILVIVVVTYFSAIAAGQAAALRDQDEKTSELPVVRSITTSDGKPLPFEGYRMLLAGKDSILLFKPKSGPSESPFMHILKRDATREITITR